MSILKELAVDQERPVFEKSVGHNVFNQLAVKIDMDGVEDADYFAWLDERMRTADDLIPGIRFLEKLGVRTSPPLNTAVYYDTADYKLLPTGSLLRTSCNVVTHAFCAFKTAEDSHGNRLDRRHVFEGEEKAQIQQAPFSPASVAIVKRLLSRDDIDHPGVFLKQEFGITASELSPAVVLRGHRSTYYVLLGDLDILRCSIDRSTVYDFRTDVDLERPAHFREVELAIYPRISPEISGDPRVVDAIRLLADSLMDRFGKSVIYAIKYQRAGALLGIASRAGATAA
jgi:hypothetical protein